MSRVSIKPMPDGDQVDVRGELPDVELLGMRDGRNPCRDDFQEYHGQRQETPCLNRRKRTHRPVCYTASAMSIQQREQRAC